MLTCAERREFDALGVREEARPHRPKAIYSNDISLYSVVLGESGCTDARPLRAALASSRLDPVLLLNASVEQRTDPFEELAVGAGIGAEAVVIALVRRAGGVDRFGAHWPAADHSGR